MNYFIVCYSYDLVKYRFKKFTSIEDIIEFKKKYYIKCLYFEIFEQLTLERCY